MLRHKILERLLLVIFCCLFSPFAMAGEPPIKFILSDGFNTVDTFQGTYNRGMIYQKGDVTVPLSLSDDEINKIYKKMVEIDFINYPKELFPPRACLQIQKIEQSERRVCQKMQPRCSNHIVGII
jgi:hypothetical protein